MWFVGLCIWRSGAWLAAAAQTCTRFISSCDPSSTILIPFSPTHPKTTASSCLQAMEILGSLEKENIPKTTVHFNRALKALVKGNQQGQLQGVSRVVRACGLVG